MKSRIFRFYQWVRSYQDSVLASTLPPLPAKITGLTADLLKFQTKAVQWMLAKEQAAVADVQQSVNKLHPLWQEIHTEGLSPLYYNPYTGRYVVQLSLDIIIIDMITFSQKNEHECMSAGRYII